MVLYNFTYAVDYDRSQVVEAWSGILVGLYLTIINSVLSLGWVWGPMQVLYIYV